MLLMKIVEFLIAATFIALLVAVLLAALAVVLVVGGWLVSFF